RSSLLPYTTLFRSQTATARTAIKGSADHIRNRIRRFTSWSLLTAISRVRIFMRDERPATKQTFAARLRHLRRDVRARTLHGARPAAQLGTPLHRRALRWLRRPAHAAGDGRGRALLLLPRRLLGRRAVARLDTQIAGGEDELPGGLRAARRAAAGR